MFGAFEILKHFFSHISATSLVDVNFKDFVEYFHHDSSSAFVSKCSLTGVLGDAQFETTQKQDTRSTVLKRSALKFMSLQV